MAITQIYENGYPMPRMPMNMYPMGAVPGVGDQMDDHFRRHWLKYLLAAGLFGRSAHKKYGNYNTNLQELNRLKDFQTRAQQYEDIIKNSPDPQQKAQATQALDNLYKQGGFAGAPGLELELRRQAQATADAAGKYKNTLLGGFLGGKISTNTDDYYNQNQELPGQDLIAQWQQQQQAAQQKAAIDAENQQRAAWGLGPVFDPNSMTQDRINHLANNIDQVSKDEAAWLNNNLQGDVRDAFINRLKLGNQSVYDQVFPQKPTADPNQQQPNQPPTQQPAADPNQQQPNQPPTQQPAADPNQQQPNQPPTQQPAADPNNPLSNLAQDMQNAYDQIDANNNPPAPQPPTINGNPVPLQPQPKPRPRIRPRPRPRPQPPTPQPGPGPTPQPPTPQPGPGPTPQPPTQQQNINASQELGINDRLLLVMNESENPDYDNYQDNHQDTHQDDGQEDSNDNKIPTNKDDDKPTFFQRHKKKFVAGGLALLGAAGGATGVHLSKNNHLNKAANYYGNASKISPTDNYRSVLKANLMTKGAEHEMKAHGLNKYDIVQKVKDSFNNTD